MRYFRYQESLNVDAFTSVACGGPLDGDVYFNDTITNNLIGPQIGFDLAYCLGCNVRLFISPKVGIYANFIDSNFDAEGRQVGGNVCRADQHGAELPQLSRRTAPTPASPS